MNLTIIALLALSSVVTFVLVWAALHQGKKADAMAAETEAETQDDFTVSIARFGYIRIRKDA